MRRSRRKRQVRNEECEYIALREFIVHTKCYKPSDLVDVTLISALRVRQLTEWGTIALVEEKKGVA